MNDSPYTSIPDVNLQNKIINMVEYTPLHGAVMDNNYNLVCTLHQRHNAKINVKTKIKTTPLHDAVLCCSHEILLYLLENGADVDAVDNTGSTPLYYACAKKDYMKAMILYKYGGDMFYVNEEGSTPVHFFEINKWNYAEFMNAETPTCIIKRFPKMRNWMKRMVEKISR